MTSVLELCVLSMKQVNSCYLHYSNDKVIISPANLFSILLNNPVDFSRKPLIKDRGLMARAKTGLLLGFTELQHEPFELRFCFVFESVELQYSVSRTNRIAFCFVCRKKKQGSRTVKASRYFISSHDTEPPQSPSNTPPPNNFSQNHASL